MLNLPLVEVSNFVVFNLTQNLRNPALQLCRLFKPKGNRELRNFNFEEVIRYWVDLLDQKERIQKGGNPLLLEHS